MSVAFSFESERAIDQQLAKQLAAYECAQQAQADTKALENIVKTLSQALGKGQVCLSLTAEQAHSLEHYQVVFQADTNAQYQNQPLVLANHKLYLARYYFYEQNVLQQIQSRLSAVALTVEEITQLRQILDNLFKETPTNGQPDWQKAAAASACVQSFNVITGGPGTGKTTTVTKLLSALLSLNPDLHIALAAPTGKAAARMTESIRGAKNDPRMVELPHKERIPDSSLTLHRLLGWRPQGMRYHAGQHLPYDCVVIDEASMIDLPMMSHLLSALAPQAKIILLGDRDQLASVEVGSVLADLCDAGTEHGFTAEFAELMSQLTGFELGDYVEKPISPLQNAVAQLRVSYRFDANSGIGQLAKAVNHGEIAQAEQAFTQFTDVQWHVLDDESLSKNAHWQQAVLQGFTSYAQALKQQLPIDQIFNAFNQFQVLVAMRQGPYGVEQVNLQLLQLLQRHQLIEASDQLWYHGRPVMITQNDYNLNLFNGDVGIALRQADGKVRVAFFDADGKERLILPSRLPSHETAFAMTVHKSQGSEFTQVCLLLPNRYQPLITRELIYTAITRAKEKFVMFAEPKCWQQGLFARVERASGLREILWDN